MNPETATPLADGLRRAAAVVSTAQAAPVRTLIPPDPRLHDLLDHATDAVVVVDPDGAIVGCNAPARILFGDIGPGVAVDRLWPSPTPIALAADAIPRALREGRWRGTVVMPWRGAATPIEHVLVGHHAPDGRVLGLSVIATPPAPAGVRTLAGIPALPLGDQLGLALGAARAVAAVHRHGLVHRSLEPATFTFVEPAVVRITGFGSAQPVVAGMPAAIEDTQSAAAAPLPYMSPERTGRVNRPVDRRSDLYSLGVVLYELFTGVTPLSAEDPLEWVHAHVARVPPTLRERRPELPATIDEIVMRLLAKDPEDRYQSAAGLIADLHRSGEQLATFGAIEPFVLGSRDVPEIFQIPQRLYGREAPLRTLVELFGRVAEDGRSQLALIEGPPGVGKTMLVRALQETVTGAGGAIVSGKFAQQGPAVPYAPFAQAIGELVQGALARPPAQLAALQERLREAVGLHGAVLTELVPRASLLLGETPPLPPVALPDAQPRAHRVIASFLDVIAADRPLVLVIDDLGWGDPASAALVADLLAHRRPRALLIVATHRDELGSASLPHTQELAALASTTIKLRPLDLEATAALLADTLGVQPRDCGDLAQVVLEKTGGNPYFVIQFLHALHRDGLISDDRPGGGWSWHTEQIAGASITDNVVGLITGRLLELPQETQALLATAAFLGDRFDRETLALASAQHPDDVESGLWDAVRQRLVSPRDGGYRFAHDRVQQAAHELVPTEERPARHLQIARRLVAGLAADDIEDHVFAIAGHAEAGSALLVDDAERLVYAALNLRAGRRAMAAAAHRSAAGYLATGLALLPAGTWETDHRLAFDLRLDRARCEHLGGDIDIAEAVVGELVEHAVDPGDVAAAYGLRIELSLARSQPGEAVDAGIRGWQQLGLALDPNLTAADLDRAAERVWALLGDRPIEALLDCPPTGEPAALASTALIGPLLTSAFIDGRHDLAMFLMVESARLSLTHGNTPASPLLLALFGSILPARFGRHEQGRRLGQAAHARVLRDGALPLLAQTSVYVGNTTYWTDPFASCLPYFQSGFRSGVRTGDLAHAGFCALFSLVMRYAAGNPLAEVVREAEPLLAFADEMKLPENRDALLIVERMAQSLMGTTAGIANPTDEAFDGEVYRGRMWTERAPFYQAILTIHEASAHVIGHQVEAGLRAADRFDRVRGALAWHSMLGEAEPWFALARAAAWDDATPQARPVLRERIARAAEEVAGWAAHSPANFRARAELLRAELARIDGRHDEAGAAYERAIAAAREHGTIHHEALARELAGRFYLGRGLASVGHACLREARDRYDRWGAAAKVAQLDAEFRGVLGAEPTAVLAPELDMLAVVRGSQAISGELDAAQLPATLLRIAVAAAGAQVGRLLEVSGATARLVALAETEHEVVHVTLPGDGPQGSATPQSVVDYVLRTGERVLLGDARTDPVFGADPAITARGVRSLLGQPIVRHGVVVGLLILEHRLVADAFTPQRLTAVEVLAAQAAISVETARLLGDVREENRVRRRTEDELRASEEQFRSLVESAPDAIVITDPGGTVVLANSRAEQLFGRGRELLVGAGGDELVPDIGWSGTSRPREAAGGLEVERRGLSADGTSFPVEVTLSPLERPEGIWTIGVVRDVTERKRLEHELERAADHDALTGLLNRASLERELAAAIENVERSRSVGVLLVLDLDHIAGINDTVGPNAGDELIRGIAHAIGERVRPTDTLARLDGDEFALILTRTDLGGAQALAEELLALVRDHPLEHDGRVIHATASIGLAAITAGAATAQTLLAAADVALNQAKEDGRDRAAVYTPDSHRRASERHTWSERIRHALDFDEFTLHAQPILDLHTGHTTHSELLIRMVDGEALVAPGAFLPTAERTGSITLIDRWVIREAVRISAQGDGGLLELNLSARSLGDIELPDYIEREVEQAGADPSSLIFEITETAAIANLASAAALAERLTALGCRFALDDFGVGFGSFYYLKRLPLHYIKIDGDFIQSLTRSRADQHVTKAIVDVAQGMGLKTIAEFVEDAETLELLRTYGVDYAQGFHIGRPKQVREPV